MRSAHEALSTVPGAASSAAPVRTRSDTAALPVLLAALSVGGAWAVLHLPLRHIPIGELFTPEHVTFFSMVDSSAQRLAHRALLALVALSSLLASLYSRTREPMRVALAPGAALLLSSRPANLVSACVFAAVCMYLLIQPSNYPLWFSIPGAPLLRLFDTNVARVLHRLAAIVRWETTAHPYASYTAAALALLLALVMHAVRIRSSGKRSALGRLASPGFWTDARILTAAAVVLVLVNPLITLLLALELLMIALLYAAGRRMSGAELSAVIGVLLLAYAGFLLIPGLVRPIAPTSPTLEVPGGLALNYVELHYAFTLGPGDRIALGRPVFDGATPYYGLLLPLALGRFEKTWGLLDFGAHIRLVQALDVLFLVLAVMAYRAWKPRHLVSIVVPMLLILPWLHSSHLVVLHPNQSGWRSLCFPVAMLALLWTRRQPLTRSVAVLAVTMGLLALLNLETAVALGAGFVVYVGCRSQASLAGAALEVGRLVIGSLLALALVLGVLSVMSGDEFTASMHALTGQLHLLRTFASGYGGAPLYADLVVLWVLAHATYLLVRSLTIRTRQPLSASLSFRTAVASIILVWGGYYANRPAPWNVWSYLYLYAFLIAAYFDPRVWRVVVARLQRGALSAPLIVFVLIIMPLLASTNTSALIMAARNLRDGDQATATVSGIRVGPAMAALLKNKADYLRSMAPRSGVYFSLDSFLMPLMSGVDNGLPFIDTFGETFSAREFELLLKQVRERKPALILFDDPATELSGTPAQQAFFDRIRATLAGTYREAGTSSGWQVWQRERG